MAREHDAFGSHEYTYVDVGVPGVRDDVSIRLTVSIEWSSYHDCKQVAYMEDGSRGLHDRIREILSEYLETEVCEI